MIIKCKDVKEFCSDFFGTDIAQHSRKGDLPIYRNIYYVLCVKYARDSSYRLIGLECGNRDHATAMHGFKKFTEEMKIDNAMFDDIRALYQKCEVAFRDKYSTNKTVRHMIHLDGKTELELKKIVNELRVVNKKVNSRVFGKMEVIRRRNKTITRLEKENFKLRSEKNRFKNRLKKLKNIEVELEKVG